jgi:geranylgeranyl diphosphate synthase type II
VVTKTLEKTKKLVWPVIDSYLKDPVYPKQFSLKKKYHKETDFFWKINRIYPERKGKYLRPSLVLLTSNALGHNSKKAILTAATMQMSQEWILIHDDVEDKSDYRRDKPTLQKLYGNELAINAGDALHIIMWKMISDINNPKIAQEFYTMILRTALGQAVEQIWTNSKKKQDQDNFIYIIDSKAGYYTIAGPMRLGAVLAGATTKQIELITNFGLHLGRCFQLVDDILDYKQDIKEGKATIANTKGLKFAKELAKKEKEIAREIFERDLKFLSQNPARKQLAELIDFILEREY